MLTVFCLWLLGTIALALGIPQGMASAAKVGDVSVSVRDYNFYYNAVVNSMKSQAQEAASQYGIEAEEYLSAIEGLDVKKSFDKQPCKYGGEDKPGYTWDDYFRDQAMPQLQKMTALSEKAKAAGITLDDDDKKEVEEILGVYKKNAETAKLSFASYLTATFGKAVTEASVRSVLERESLASKYQTKLKDETSITDAEIDQYYADNKATYDKATYRVFEISGEASGDSPTEAEETAAMNDAKSKADKMKNGVTDEASFIRLVKESEPESDTHVHDDSETLKTAQTKGNITPTALADWVFASDRKAGDVTVIEDKDNSKYYVAFLVTTQSREEYYGVNVRHVLISYQTFIGPLDTGATDYKAEDKAKTKAEAEKIYNEWKESGNTTEASFGLLAVNNSHDGNASEGGIYEHIAKGNMVPAFENWIFDPVRKPGDTDIVETQYGCHIMYFVGMDKELYWKYNVRTDMTNKRVSDQVTEILKDYQIVNNDLGLWIAKR